jgi:ribosome biogenesis GTPase
VATLMPLLEGQSSIFIGQSGMGKSSLINLLVPDADIAVREISAALDTGKHTTTFTRLYTWARRLDHRFARLPGIRPVPPVRRHARTRLRRIRPYLGGCKFYNCRHLIEPQCAVLAAVADGKIAKFRHTLYGQLLHESAQTLY